MSALGALEVCVVPYVYVPMAVVVIVCPVPDWNALLPAVKANRATDIQPEIGMPVLMDFSKTHCFVPFFSFCSSCLALTK